MCRFRNLTAADIEVRVQQVTKNGNVILLLYKDARCDMNILDETFGEAGWQNRFYECKGNLFCSVGIFIDGVWIWKDDCGSESFSDAQKGEASDARKRAGFAWGIGRELYTAPFICIPGDGSKATLKEGKCYDKFSVSKIAISEDKKIVELEIEGRIPKKNHERFSAEEMDTKKKHSQAKRLLKKVRARKDTQSTYFNSCLGLNNKNSDWLNIIDLPYYEAIFSNDIPIFSSFLFKEKSIIPKEKFWFEDFNHTTFSLLRYTYNYFETFHSF